MNNEQRKPCAFPPFSPCDDHFFLRPVSSSVQGWKLKAPVNQKARGKEREPRNPKHDINDIPLRNSSQNRNHGSSSSRPSSAQGPCQSVPWLLTKEIKSSLEASKITRQKKNKCARSIEVDSTQLDSRPYRALCF